MAGTNPCTVPNCRHKINTDGLCTVHLNRLERFGDVLAHLPPGDPSLHAARSRMTDGPFFCTCQTSRPAPKVCGVCGYPCVWRMTEEARARAIRRWPALRDQVVDEPEKESTP